MMPICSIPTSQESLKYGYASESRSTSAGSHRSGEPHRQGSGHVLSSLNSDLPEYEYPVPVIVRNTFIDTQMVRPLSLDEFFEERRIQSCISCPVTSRDNGNLQDDGIRTVGEPQTLRTITTGVQNMMTSIAAAAGFDMSIGNTTGSGTAPCGNNGFCTEAPAAASVPPPENSNSIEAMPRILMLSEALPQPCLGSPEMPTVGSAGHNLGACKPCAFFHTRGCENDVQCSFCHLCPPDEKRRRAKDKVAMLRDMRHQHRRQLHL